MAGRFGGVYCAAVTPMSGGGIDTDALKRHLVTLAAEGCDGVLLMGTTGEGPSLSLSERELILRTAVEANTGLKLMAGTGTPSLTDTLEATRMAFEIGADCVVVIPPFFFRNASVAGLRAFYGTVIEQAVPQDGALLAYHIPQVSGVAVPKELLTALVGDYGDRVAGVKDSGGDMAYSLDLIAALPSLDVFVGSERLLLEGLRAGAVGCITAGANVLAPKCVDVYRGWRDNDAEVEKWQQELTEARLLIESYAPAPATYKSLLSIRHGGDGWDVRPPLLNHAAENVAELVSRLQALESRPLRWLNSLG